MQKPLRLWVSALLALAGCSDAGLPASGGNQQTQFRLSGPEGVRNARLLESFVELDIRDTARQFRAVIERNNGRLDTLVLPATRVLDSTVLRVVEGRVHPVDAGRSAVEFDLNERLRLRAVVGVEERIFGDSIWLARGQVRAWELRPGWHRITVDANAPPGEPQPLELAADLICVPDARGPKETITCRVQQNTRLVLRHTGAGTQPGPALAVVTITRVPR